MNMPCRLLLTVSAIAVSTPAFAQESAEGAAASTAIQSEILVTAQRRTESVQDVPIPVTIVSADQLQAQAVQEVGDLGRTTASLRMSENPGGSGGGGYIRGVGTFSRSRAAEPSVGIVVDGVVQGLTNIRNLSDIARVEVLRGPQGTLFGQAVSAGVINITTIAPDPTEVSGTVSTELSFDNFAGSKFGKQQIRGAVNLPVADNMAVRVSGYGNWTQGVLENIYQGNDDYRDEYGVRGRFKADFGPLTVNFSAEYNDEKRGNGYFLTIRDTGSVVRSSDAVLNANGLYDASYSTFVPATSGVNYDRVTYCGLQPNINNFEMCSDSVSLQTYKTQGYSGQLDYEFDNGLTLTSITAYRKLKSTTQNDIDNLPEGLSLTSVHSGLITKYKQFTQEFRLASDDSQPLTYTLGGFYFKSVVDSKTGPAENARTAIYTRKGGLAIEDCFPVSTVAACDVFITPGGFENDQHWSTENKSIFGEARYKFGDVAVFAGGRYTTAKLAQDSTVYNQDGSIHADYDDAVKDKDFEWRFGAEYKPNRDILLYATVARGYKNGQITPLQNNDIPDYLKPEKPTSYELGVKSNWLGGRLLANLSAFYMDVRNYQTARCGVDEATQATTCLPINIDKIKTKGIEGDVFGRIGNHLRLNANFIYNVVKYPNGFGAQDGSDLSGMQLQDAPRFSAAVFGNYDFAVTDTIDGFVGFDVSYKSKTRLSDFSAIDYYVYKGHTTVGARIGMEVKDNWRVALFAKNLFNQNDPQQFSTLVNQDGSRNPLKVQGVFNTQSGLRQVGLQASLDF